jgi:phosphoribosylanthranilate isomerase
MTKIKICGLRRIEDISYVNQCLPDYCGFVFAESKRKVTAEQAQQLRQSLHPKITPVGVFVNESLQTVAELVNHEIIDIAQLHGDENETYIRELRRLLKRGQIMRAIRVKSSADAKNAELLPVDHLLFDACSGQGYGGTGETFNWDMLEGIKKPFFLAGGINIDNVETAIRKVHPYAIDFSSAVETNGVKDRDKIFAIVDKIRTI